MINDFWDGLICGIAAVAFIAFVWRVIRHEFGGNWIGF